MKKIVFALCEGPHDVAFLYRLLKVTGYVHYNEALKNYPKTLGSLILQEVEKSKIIEVQNLRVDEVKRPFLPAEILIKEETIFLLYSIGGDSRKDKRIQLINSIQHIVGDADADSDDFSDGYEYCFAYFFDADDKGIDYRITEIEKELNDKFDVTDIKIQHGELPVKCNNIGLGAYIFTEEGEDSGDLESILLPLMEKDNEDIFTKARDFLSLKDNSRLKRLKIKTDGDGSLKEVRSKDKMKFDPDKSMVNIAGQLQNSGKANTVIIKDCDYINLDKIRGSKACMDIIDFLGKL